MYVYLQLKGTVKCDRLVAIYLVSGEKKLFLIPPFLVLRAKDTLCVSICLFFGLIVDVVSRYKYKG